MKLIFVILSMLCAMVFPNFSRADAQDVSFWAMESSAQSEIFVHLAKALQF